MDPAKLFFVASKPKNDYKKSKVVGMFKGITSKFGANIRIIFLLLIKKYQVFQIFNKYVLFLPCVSKTSNQNNMTTIRQLSIFLENKSGRLHEVLEVLGNEKINITAMTIADTLEYGILRLLVSDPEEAYKLLKMRGFSVNLTDVFSLSVSHKAGSLSKVLKKFAEENLSIEYMYAFSLGEKAIIVLRTDNRPKAFEIIERNNFTVISEDEIRNL